MRFASGFRISRLRKLNKDGVEATGTRCVPEVPEGLIIAESHKSRFAFGGTSESEPLDPGTLFRCQDLDIAYMVLNQQPQAS